MVYLRQTPEMYFTIFEGFLHRLPIHVALRTQQQSLFQRTSRCDKVTQRQLNLRRDKQTQEGIKLNNCRGVENDGLPFQCNGSTRSR